MLKLGELGESFVARWLVSQGCHILSHRWRCRWGEIDLIAQEPSRKELRFVEVKTRSLANWDEDGLLAISPQKQTRIIKTAALFLTQNPHLAETPCRFDVALVTYQKHNSCAHFTDAVPMAIQQGYQFMLQNYLESAFEA